MTALRSIPMGPSFRRGPSRRRQIRHEEATLIPSKTVVGTFRSAQVVGGRPASLGTWRVTSPERRIVSAVAELLGGSTALCATGNTQIYQVTTHASLVRVSLRIDAVLPKRGGAPMRSQRTESNLEQPGALTRIVFHLAELPVLGTFQLVASSRSLAESLRECANTGPIGICELVLRRFVDCSSTGTSVRRSAITLAPVG